MLFTAAMFGEVILTVTSRDNKHEIPEFYLLYSQHNGEKMKKKKKFSSVLLCRYVLQKPPLHLD